eukprot:TRINITY_DN10098_c0_g1_i2.p1 TRINITY_DN10098_c0_g1~~TRINITY_DN10098_c0_g1_i2.p1  ORF type:complete len:176 (+),score=24.70 TRINITY_DN10098_c0_g1_i2:615-1142(+)
MRAAFKTITNVIKRCCKILERMHEGLSAQVFYDRIRPCVSGWRNNLQLPNGLDYEDVPHEEAYRCLYGASAGHSALIASFDVFFGAIRPLDDNGEPHNLVKMHDYIPAPHRQFLYDLSEARKTLDDVLRTTSCSSLQAAFNSGVKALAEFRTTHMALVARFILAPARQVREPTEP